MNLTPGLVLLLALVSLMMSCSSSEIDKSANKSQGNNDNVPQTALVKVQALQKGSLQLSIPATGVFRSKQQVPITPEISGTIIEKRSELGQYVAKGDTILLLDPEPYELALAQAEASLASTRVAYDQASRDFQRAKTLQSSNDISDYELESAHLAERTAAAKLKMAEAALRLAQRNLRLTKLVSPINGHIAELQAQIGQQVSPGTTLGMIVALDQIEIEVGLSGRDIVHIKTGMEVRIRADALPGQVFHGKVRSVGVAGLDLGKTFPVIVAIDNSSGLIRPGMVADLEILYADYDNVLRIPRSAVVETDIQQPCVYIVDDGLARQRPVILGPGDSQQVIVESGVSAGDKLVIEGQDVLHDSVHVKIL